MTRTVPTTEPTSAPAGDTWQWRATFAEYPASEGWAIAYHFRGIGALTWDAAWVEADGDDYLVTIPAASTALLAAGTYHWAAYATKDGQRFEARKGVTAVTLDLATATAGAAQSFAERMVGLLETQLAELAAQPIESYAVAQRSAARRKMEEVSRLLAVYRAQVQRQRSQGLFGKPIAVAFTEVGT